MQDLKSEEQFIYFSWQTIPENNVNFNRDCTQQQKFRQVIKMINIKNVMRFRVSIEDLIAQKPDALSNAYNFFNNLSNLITDFKKCKSKFKRTKIVNKINIFYFSQQLLFLSVQLNCCFSYEFKTLK